MFPANKNSYLQSRSNGINPRIINRAVNLARSQPTIDCCDLDPPFHRLTSEQPNVPIYEDVDVTRRPLAFGRWAIPKLRRELHSKDPRIVLKAVLSITDLAKDPEKGYEAIRLKIPDRMVDLLNDDDAAIREATCMALTVLAGRADGRMAMVKNSDLLSMLSLLVEDEVAAVRVKVAALLEMISRFWPAADDLVYAGFVQILLNNLIAEDVEMTALHLKTLESLMYGEGKNVALDHGAFDIFVSLMTSQMEEIVPGAAKCLTIITSTTPGKEAAFKDNTLSDLYKLLHMEIPEIYTAAASAIMFCTILTKGKVQASKMEKLPSRLVALAKGTFNPTAQLFCLKALTNICEHPAVRQRFKGELLDEVRNIVVADSIPELQECKQRLIEIVTWTPCAFK